MDAIKGTVNKLASSLHIGGGQQEPVAEPPSEQEFKDLKDAYEKAGQGQVFSFWDDLKPQEQGELYQQAKSIDVENINKITEKTLHAAKSEGEDKKAELEPLPESATTSTIDSNESDLKKWYDSGLKLISEGKVGVVLMAGGQGTRLGSSAPKGCYDIELPSHKSLFQLQAERIWKLQSLASKIHSKEEVTIPWYIMTSGPTRKPTQDYFEEKKYFGLNRNNVIFFEQGVLPCITMEGKILLESKSKVAVAPDGNGGLYNGLINAGIVRDMEKRGVKHIHAYCVDNCLVRVADPTFIGFSAEKEVSIATKVVRKRNAKESVGLILQKNGKPDVVEYSEVRLRRRATKKRKLTISRSTTRQLRPKTPRTATSSSSAQPTSSTTTTASNSSTLSHNGLTSYLITSPRRRSQLWTRKAMLSNQTSQTVSRWSNSSSIASHSSR